MKNQPSQHQAEEIERRNNHPDSHRFRGGAGNLWLGMIIGGLLVLVAVLAYQLFTTRQQLGTTANNTQAVPPATTQAPVPNGLPAEANQPPAATAAPSSTPSVPTSNGIQPGQFVQNAYGNKAKVELLKVNRIPNQPNAVNVQFRVYAVRADKGTYEDNIYLSHTTASNSSTGETYKPISGQATNFIPPLKSMYLDKLPSVDAYIWLQIPEGVNAVNIQLPSTEEFKHVPISQPMAATQTISTPIQPGQFVKYAFKNKAQVELLKVNRIPGERGVVNIQMRMRSTPKMQGQGGWMDVIPMRNVTARNPDTSETFSAVPQKWTDRVTSLQEMETKNIAHIDTYVWLNVPEDTNTLDIYVPNTQTFTNVPIANQ